MDKLICKQPYFQWDTETHSCLGCIEDNKLNEDCWNCEDHIRNIDTSVSERKI